MNTLLRFLTTILRWMWPTRAVPPTNQYEPNPDTGAPEPKPDDEYPDEGQPTPEDLPDLPDPEPETEPPVVVIPDPVAPPIEPLPVPSGPHVYTAAEQDAFFKALGLPYGTVELRKSSTEAFQYGCTWTNLVIDGGFGALTTAAAETCVANNHRVSKYFHIFEFRCKGQDAKYGGAHCKDCKRVWVSRDLIRILDTIRETIYQGPLEIVTGYRCPGYNAFVGGVYNSAHMLGYASDIPRRFSWRRFVSMGLHGIGKSRVDRESVVHVDIDSRLRADYVFQE